MINIPKGTKDVLPFESYKWHYLENTAKDVAHCFGYREIRTPVFEHTELFLRGVGDTTDIVNKEMYTFIDKGDRSMTLKPEGTAGVARSFIENGLDNNMALPVKMYYITPVFRYEKPQSGRLREHHQFGVELFGSFSPAADVEVISLVKNLFDRLKIDRVKLYINSIGCPECRKSYSEALKKYYGEHISEICPTCIERMDKNPLRLLDCKVESCIKVGKDAPIVLDYLCDDCKAHHEKVCQLLSCSGIEYEINPRIVRGLDYYTRTVFEFVSTAIGSQGTVCGGGRYNNLVEEIGGKSIPAVGFGMGLERLIMVMEAAGLYLGEDKAPEIYIAPLGEEQYFKAVEIVNTLRKNNVSAITDLMGKSLKAQMKYADKIGVKYVIVVGENEIAEDKAVLKNMLSKENVDITLSQLTNYFL